MSLFAKMRLFQKGATALFCIYMAVMIFVVFKCFTRKSGNTGMDMSLIQQMRSQTKE